MFKIVEYSKQYKDSWSKFVESAHDSNIAHLIEWRDIINEGLGHEPKYFMVMDGEQIKAILPLFLVTTWWRSRYLISLPWIDYGGLCAENSESESLFIEDIKRLALNEKVKFVEFRATKKYNEQLVQRDDKVTFLLQLNEDPEILWKGFDAKLRNQIRKAQKSGLTSEFGGIEKLHDFYKVFCVKMRNLGTPVWGKCFFRLILERLSDSARIILTKKDEQVVAAGLVLNFKDRLYVPSAASYDSALKFCPNHALYWDVIRFGCEQGYKYFDFGRSARDSNTFNFKKQWTPEPTSLCWQYYFNGITEMPSINPGNPKYKLFINIWRRLPLIAANFLGPKVIRNFP